MLLLLCVCGTICILSIKIIETSKYSHKKVKLWFIKNVIWCHLDFSKWLLFDYFLMSSWFLNDFFVLFGKCAGQSADSLETATEDARSLVAALVQGVCTELNSPVKMVDVGMVPQGRTAVPPSERSDFADAMAAREDRSSALRSSVKKKTNMDKWTAKKYIKLYRTL